MIKSRRGGWAVSFRPTVLAKSDTLERRIQSIVRAIEDGMYNPTMKQRIADLEARTQEFAETLSVLKEPPVVCLQRESPSYAASRLPASKGCLPMKSRLHR